MSFRKYSAIIALVLGGAAFVLQLIDTWHILATRMTGMIPAVLVHAGAALSVVSIILKVRRKEPVLLTDVLMVAFMMLFTWSVYLNLIEKCWRYSK